MGPSPSERNEERRKNGARTGLHVEVMITIELSFIKIVYEIKTFLRGNWKFEFVKLRLN